MSKKTKIFVFTTRNCRVFRYFNYHDLCPYIIQFDKKILLKKNRILY
ncbi:hypothetical protein BVAVS116_H0099 (plasmid) [Borreliella valaisiana VS116]|uniref:Uncharacterized protein n=1 Tax=Borreliella valaisiana VS116 TaxID=445987 RepID=C0R914_BORVA|nr:hypothetical protein BVAVS116_H0099 [Borreliella valaisiana VS116]